MGWFQTEPMALRRQFQVNDRGDGVDYVCVDQYYNASVRQNNTGCNSEW